MLGRSLASLVFVLVWVGVAAADPPTTVTGRVTDVLDRPVPGARVYVLPRAGEPHQTRTARDGRYSVDVSTSGTHGVVIAIGKAHTFRTVLVERGATNTLDVEVELDIAGGEVIKIVDRKRPQPAVKPKPMTDPRKSLPYSEEAVERDAWARAWLLLDVNEQGKVTRLKLLEPPGYDLEAICIQEAFKLRFEPARDAAGRPMSTYVVWTMEWPSWGWLIQGHGTAMGKPNDHDEMAVRATNIRRGVTGHDMVKGVDEPIGGNWSRPQASAFAFPHALSRVPCAGSGPLNLDLRNRAYRNCSQADLSVADSLPWITPETAATAIAELVAPNLELMTEERDVSRVPGVIATVVTGGLAVGLVVSFLKFRTYADRIHPWKATTDPRGYEENRANRSTWAKVTLGMTGAVIVSGAVSSLLWKRNESRRSFSVQPTGDGGAAASFGGSF